MDLRAGTPEADSAPVLTQPPGHHRQIEHQRSVGEHQSAEVDDHFGPGANRPRHRLPAESLRGPIFVASAEQSGGRVHELDDPENLPEVRNLRQETQPHSRKLTSVVSVEAVTDALRDVIDPELGLDFVELGLIYGVEVDDGTVKVTYTLTSPGCPIGPQVSEQIEEFVSELDGVQEVQPTMTFSPPWTPERMSDDAKFALGF